MNDVTEWFAGLATIGGFLYFLAGFGTSYLIHCLRAKLAKRSITLPWHIAGIAIGIAAIIMVSVQSQVAYTTAEDTAKEVQECQREFNQALRDGRAITSENEKLSVEQGRKLAEKDRAETEFWSLILVPSDPVMRELKIDDPRREAYSLDLLRKYAAKAARLDAEVKKIGDRRLWLIENRPPLPDPTCGK